MTDIIEKQIVSNTYMREDTGGGAMDCGIVNRSLNIPLAIILLLSCVIEQ